MAARSGGKELAGLALQQPFGLLYCPGPFDQFAPAQTSFPLIRPSSSFFLPLSPIGRRGFVLQPLCPLSAVSESSRTSTRYPEISASVMPHSDAASRDTGKSTRTIHFPGPRIGVRVDTVRITCGEETSFVIPRSDAGSRNIRKSGLVAIPLMS